MKKCNNCGNFEKSYLEMILGRSGSAHLWAAGAKMIVSFQCVFRFLSTFVQNVFKKMTIFVFFRIFLLKSRENLTKTVPVLGPKWLYPCREWAPKMMQKATQSPQEVAIQHELGISRLPWVDDIDRDWSQENLRKSQEKSVQSGPKTWTFYFNFFWNWLRHIIFIDTKNFGPSKKEWFRKMENVYENLSKVKSSWESQGI